MHPLKLFTIAILLFLCSFTKAQTSVYHPFPDSNAVWTVGWADMSCQSNYQYEMKGDTLIGTLHYRKIEIKLGSHRCTTCLTLYNINSFGKPYIGAIRQDTIAKKIYYILPDSTMEQILYDFNLQVGDTIKGFFDERLLCACGVHTITSIDSILIDKSYRKRYTYGFCGGKYIIEGIGNTHGLLEPLDQFEASSILYCLMVNNKILYPDGASLSSCTVSIAENLYDKHTVSVFPNPASNKLTIKFHANFRMQDIEITLYNILGEKVNANYSSLYQQEDSFEIEMDASCLHNGFYLLSIESKGQIIGKEKILITQ